MHTGPLLCMCEACSVRPVGDTFASTACTPKTVDAFRYRCDTIQFNSYSHINMNGQSTFGTVNSATTILQGEQSMHLNDLFKTMVCLLETVLYKRMVKTHVQHVRGII